MRALVAALLLLLATPAAAGHMSGGFFWDFPNSYVTANGAELGGTWILQPYGIGSGFTTGFGKNGPYRDPDASKWDWIFHTTTNSTLLGPEVIMVYVMNFDEANFNIFGWSCSATDPCPMAPGGIPTCPNAIDPTKSDCTQYVGVIPTWSVPQYIYTITDPGGHPQHATRWIIKTIELGGPVPVGDPAEYRVTVSFWNKITNVFDTIWEHEYTDIKRNCNDVTTPCGEGGWLASVEADESPSCVLPCKLPHVREFGVQDLYLIDDTGPVAIAPPGVSFQTPAVFGELGVGWGPPDPSPVEAPWNVFHQNNTSFGIGNYLTRPTRNQSIGGASDAWGVR